MPRLQSRRYNRLITTDEEGKRVGGAFRRGVENHRRRAAAQIRPQPDKMEGTGLADLTGNVIFLHLEKIKMFFFSFHFPEKREQSQK